MPNLTYTDEQSNIFNEFKTTSNPMLIRARAGTGKTFCLTHLAELVPKTERGIYLAFNSHIRDEVDGRLPSNIWAYTAHKLGFAAIKRTYPEAEMDKNKVRKVVKSLSRRWGLKNLPSGYPESNYLYNIEKMVDLCRLTLTYKEQFVEYLAIKHQINFEGTNLIDNTLETLSVVHSNKDTFDFADMVYMPATDKKIRLYPQKYVFCDECQDLSRAQQEMIKKMLSKDPMGNYDGRLIACGDDFQSIYNFAGADTKSFQWFIKFQNIKMLPLTKTWRCGKNIVKIAQKIVPDIKYVDNAENGEVRFGNVSIEARYDDWVLSRKTAPLIKLFFVFLGKKQKAMVKGTDIGLNLITMIQKYKKTTDMIIGLKNDLNRFIKKLVSEGYDNYEEHEGYQTFVDKIDTLTFLSKKLKNKESVKELINLIRSIFKDDSDGIILSTVHKSKGMEADRIFLIHPEELRLPKKPTTDSSDQEINLTYVAITRAKKELIIDAEFDNNFKLIDLKKDGVHDDTKGYKKWANGVRKWVKLIS